MDLIEARNLALGKLHEAVDSDPSGPNGWNAVTMQRAFDATIATIREADANGITDGVLLLRMMQQIVGAQYQFVKSGGRVVFIDPKDEATP